MIFVLFDQYLNCQISLVILAILMLDMYIFDLVSYLIEMTLENKKKSVLLHKMFIIDLNDMSHQNVFFQLTKNYSSNSLIDQNF